MSTVEVLLPTEETQLTPGDQGWLQSFGVDPSWQSKPGMKDALNQTIAVGSLNLNVPENRPRREEIVNARNDFIKFAKIDPAALAKYANRVPALFPLDSFINAQRVFYNEGLDSSRIIKHRPFVMGYSAESINQKIQKLRERITDNPAIIINAFPATLTYSPSGIDTKFDNLEDLNLDASNIFCKYPAAISLKPESARSKVRLINRSVRLLTDRFTGNDIIDICPNLLGFNKDKLSILLRIAATHNDELDDGITPEQVVSAINIPLEKYVIALGINKGPQLSIYGLCKRAADLRLNAQARRDRAIEISKTGKLGKIGLMYIAYSK